MCKGYTCRCQVRFIMIVKHLRNAWPVVTEVWWGEGVHYIHIFLFCMINFFLNRYFVQSVSTNIWIFAPARPPPPPPQLKNRPRPLCVTDQKFGACVHEIHDIGEVHVHDVKGRTPPDHAIVNARIICLPACRYCAPTILGLFFLKRGIFGFTVKAKLIQFATKIRSQPMFRRSVFNFVRLVSLNCGWVKKYRDASLWNNQTKLL